MFKTVFNSLRLAVVGGWFFLLLLLVRVLSLRRGRFALCAIRFDALLSCNFDSIALRSTLDGLTICHYLTGLFLLIFLFFEWLFDAHQL